MDEEAIFTDFKKKAQEIIRKWLPGQSYGYNEAVSDLEWLAREVADSMWRVARETLDLEKEKRLDLLTLLGRYAAGRDGSTFFDQRPGPLVNRAKEVVDEVYRVTSPETLKT